MKMPFIYYLAIFVLLMSSGYGVAREIRFAPLPLEGKKVIHEQFQGLANYLSSSTGHQLKLVFFSDYADIIDAFSKDEVDLAYLGPLPYVILKEHTRAEEPLVCFRDSRGEASYTCSLVTFVDAGLTLEKLQGVKIGLTQPYSTCGYLAVSQMLGKAGKSLGGDGIGFEYAGSHSKAALGVVRGDYDVAGVKTAIGKRYQHMGLEQIAESTPFPGFALIANTNTLKKAEITALRESLLALGPRDSGNGRWGPQFRNGAVEPDQCSYNAVARTLKTIPRPIPGAGR